MTTATANSITLTFDDESCRQSSACWSPTPIRSSRPCPIAPARWSASARRPRHDGDDDDSQDRALGLFGVAAGALPSLFVTFGIPTDGDSDTVAARQPGLEVLRYSDPGQDRQKVGVYGVKVTGASHEDTEPIKTIDLADAAHRARVAELGALGADARYFVVAHYD